MSQMTRQNSGATPAPPAVQAAVRAALERDGERAVCTTLGPARWRRSSWGSAMRDLGVSLEGAFAEVVRQVVRTTLAEMLAPIRADLAALKQASPPAAVDVRQAGE